MTLRVREKLSRSLLQSIPHAHNLRKTAPNPQHRDRESECAEQWEKPDMFVCT